MGKNRSRASFSPGAHCQRCSFSQNLKEGKKWGQLGVYQKEQEAQVVGKCPLSRRGIMRGGGGGKGPRLLLQHPLPPPPPPPVPRSLRSGRQACRAGRRLLPVSLVFLTAAGGSSQVTSMYLSPLLVAYRARSCGGGRNRNAGLGGELLGFRGAPSSRAGLGTYLQECLDGAFGHVQVRGAQVGALLHGSRRVEQEEHEGHGGAPAAHCCASSLQSQAHTQRGVFVFVHKCPLQPRKSPPP